MNIFPALSIKQKDTQGVLRTHQEANFLQNVVYKRHKRRVKNQARTQLYVVRVVQKDKNPSGSKLYVVRVIQKAQKTC